MELLFVAATGIERIATIAIAQDDSAKVGRKVATKGFGVGTPYFVDYAAKIPDRIVGTTGVNFIAGIGDLD